MLRVGLTGGIGSGKTTVANIFHILGIPIFDADSIAKKIMENDEELIQFITTEFGEAAYTNKQLNRKYIAEIIFKDEFKLEKLNSKVHPKTIAAAEQWMKEQNTPYTIKEAALMFETAASAGVDLIIGVFAPKHIRIKRVMDRDGNNKEDVIARMGKQIDDAIKMKLCDFVIVNDEQQLVVPQVIQLHEKLMQLSLK